MPTSRKPSSIAQPAPRRPIEISVPPAEAVDCFGPSSRAANSSAASLSSASIISTRSTERRRPGAPPAPPRRRTTARPAWRSRPRRPAIRLSAADREPGQQRHAAGDVARGGELLGLGVDVEVDVGEGVGGHQRDRVVAGGAVVAARAAHRAPPGPARARPAPRRGDDGAGEEPVPGGLRELAPARRSAPLQRRAARRPSVPLPGPSRGAPAGAGRGRSGPCRDRPAATSGRPARTASRRPPARPWGAPSAPRVPA